MKNKEEKQDYSKTFAYCRKFNSLYKIINKIGTGHSANVFKVQSICNGKLFALKAYNHMRPQSNL